MGVSHRSILFRFGVAALVVAVAFAVAVACLGDVDMLMPVAMACAVVLTAIVAVPYVAHAVAGASSFDPLLPLRVRAGPTPVLAAGARPPPILLTGVLRV